MKTNAFSVFPSRGTIENAKGNKSGVFKFLFFDPPATAEVGENESKCSSNKNNKKKKKIKKPVTSLDTGYQDEDAGPPLETVNGIDEIPTLSQISMEQLCSAVEADDTTQTPITKKNNSKPKNKKDSNRVKKARAGLSVTNDDDDDIDAMVKALDAKAALASKQIVATSSPHKTNTSNSTSAGRTGVPKKKTDENSTFSFKSHKDPELTNEQKELMMRYRQRAIAGPRRTSSAATTTIAAAMSPTTSTAFAPTSQPESSNPFSFGFSVA